MALEGITEIRDADECSWFTAEAQLLQSQMAMLQSALESSKHAVAEFHRRAAANLEASEQRYQELFDNVLTGVYRMASDGELLLANPALIRMLGYESFDDLNGRKWVPPWRLATTSRPGHVIGFERSWKRKNGEKITVRESCRAVRDEDGAVLYYEGVVEDITGQKKAEIFEHDSRFLLELVARNEPIERVLQHLVRLVERQARGARCALMLARDGRLYPAAAPSLPAPFIAALEAGIPIARDHASCGSAAFRNQAVVAEDILTHSAWIDYGAIADAHGLRACWSLPVCSGRGDVLGTIDLYRNEPYAPLYAEIQIVETVRRLAAVAIEHRQLCDDLEYQAMRDRLTGLPNRRMFEDRLAAAINEAEIRNSKAALLWIDLDRFKEINDTLGHRMGDELLKQVADRFRPAIPPDALLARTGGDEFAVIALDLGTKERVLDCATLITRALGAPFLINGCEIFVTASVGISVFPDDAHSAAELQQNADAAMYRVKNESKSGFGFYEPAVGDEIRKRMELANALRRALDRHEFELHFQPQIDLSGRLRGLEALLRWNHPQKGLLGPGQFIDIAEETGLIVPIGAWVIREACRLCAEWNSFRTEPLKIAVNVSALQFYFSDLVEVVQRALESTGLSPDCLEIEVTETLVMRDAEQSAAELERLRALGVTIAIDDFGTGYSSLSYLQRLPVDLLKIDRSFLEQIDSRSASAVVEAVTALAHALGLQVVAEGIEEQHQMRAIRRIGVDLAQGFLIGRPAPASVVEQMLKAPLELLCLTA